MPAKEIVFSKSAKINGWMGTIPGKNPKPIVFPETTAGGVYAIMCEKYPNVRVGFKAEDFGPNIVAMYGEVMWMKQTEETA